MESENKGMGGALKASIICMVLGCALMFVSLWSVALYAPLFIASFILSIVAMAKDEVWGGLGMLLGNLIIPSAIFGIIFVININSATDTENSYASSNESQAEQTYSHNIEIKNFKADYYDSILEGNKAGVQFSLKNNGDSTLSYVELTAYYMDENGEIISEETFIPFNTSSLMSDESPLKPNYVWEMGEDEFLTADNAPKSWVPESTYVEVTDIDFN